MKLTATELVRFILTNLIGIRSEEVSKRQMPFDLRVTDFKTMKLTPALTTRIIKSAVATADHSVFAPVFVSQIFQIRSKGIEDRQTLHFRY